MAAGIVRNARIHIDIEGQLRPYTEGEWVIFNKDGFPIGFTYVDWRHLSKTATGHEADPEKAFKDFWSWHPDTTPLQAALKGYRIELVGPERSRALLDVHLDDLSNRRPAEQLELPNTGEEAA